MTTPMTVLALTPSVGGHYFGELLAGLTREIADARARLVVVETLPANAPQDEPGAPGDFDIPVAWDQVDGVVSITTAVDADYLRALRDRGVPVVLASTQMADFAAPVAMPDNHGGTLAAVEHLIGHGHTRIGFVGNLAQQDVRERRAAEAQALAAYGLPVDLALGYGAADNAEAGGVYAARALLASPRRPTALMVATDRNAIGLMRTLVAAGLSIPADLAIVAFDNIEAGVFSTPYLSSVNQRFDEVGALAGRLVLATIHGEEVPSTVFTSPSVMVAVRDAERLLQLGATVTAAAIDELSVALRRLSPRGDALRRITAAMTDYVERMGTSARSCDGGSTLASTPFRSTRGTCAG